MCRLPLLLALGATASQLLVTCGDPQGPVNSLAGLPPPAVATPGSNVNPADPGMFSGDRR